ncbi:MAG: 3-hydroxyacyl-CoA dehydrogenase NAD-binding domain-containing protein [Candidatus Velthaea sp.]
MMNPSGQTDVAALITVTERPGGIRVITLDNPPANAISFALSEQLLTAVQAADADPAVRAVIFTGAGGLFSFGADINDFATVPTSDTKTLRDVTAALERSAKTFVAAIDGNALGGGLELALACDYRIGSPKTKVGFPEIRLGLLPGGGGTQRLPRLIGAQDALALMLKGDNVVAEEALKKGILDEIARGNVVDAAVALIERVIATAPKRRVSERKTELGVHGMTLLATPFVVAQAHKMVPPESNGGYAAHKLVDAVEAALELDFAHGLAREYRLFEELVVSKPSAALRHLFFAERQLGKIPNLPPAEALDIKTAGVVGAGTMGTGIAITFANAGIRVVLVEPIDEQVERSKQMVFGMFAQQVKRGRISQEQAWKLGQLVSWASTYDELGEADIVIEAVFENMDVKKDVFRKLDAACKPQAILASNTSTLDIDEMASVTGRRDKFVGLHFFAPANIMRLLEIVRGADTSPQTLTTAIKLGKTLRKVAVVSANAFGFIGNRMFFDYSREAMYLLEEGVAPERIDRVMKEQFGFAMGPFATFDLSGVDVFWHIQQGHAAALGEKRTNIIDRMYETKRWGQKTGVGFYKYDGPNKRDPVPDPALLALAAEEAAKAGIAPRDVSDAEILERLAYALVNVGAGLLENGIALRPGDEDIVYIYGYGFPPHHGGPMWYADEIGVARVVARIKDFGWPVSPLLERIAQQGGTIAKYRREIAHV